MKNLKALEDALATRNEAVVAVGETFLRAVSMEDFKLLDAVLRHLAAAVVEMKRARYAGLYAAAEMMVTVGDVLKREGCCGCCRPGQLVEGIGSSLKAVAATPGGDSDGCD